MRADPVGVPLDPHTPVSLVKELPQGDKIGDAADARRLRMEGAALTSALQLGVAEASQQLATDYAKHREQFGRVIGSFQAIKHLLADAFVRQELARAGCTRPAHAGQPMWRSGAGRGGRKIVRG